MMNDGRPHRGRVASHIRHGLSRSARVIATACATALVLAAGSASLHGAHAQDGAPAVVEAEDAASEAAEPAGDADSEAESVAPDGESAEAEAPAPTRWVRGEFDAGFDGVWADGSDLNLNQSLRLRVDPPQWDSVRFRGAVWAHQDLDSDESRNSVLRDVNDAWDSDFRVRVLTLYAEVDDLLGSSTLRIGRQRILEGAAFNRIDGAYFKQRHARWDWYVFGGVRASLYDDDWDDPVYGGGASVQMANTTRVALDAYYAEEHRDESDVVYRWRPFDLFRRPYPRRVREDIGDNVYALSVWQDITANIRLFGRFTLHDGDGDELLLDLTGYAPSWDLSYQLTYRRQMDTIEDRVNDLTGFYRILGPFDEYDNVLAAVHKSLTDKLVLSLEIEAHDSRSDTTAFGTNRDYIRYAGILSATNLIPDTESTLALERWAVSGEEETWAITGEFTKHWGRLSTTLGADYQRYEDELVRYSPYPFWTNRAIVAAVPGLFTNYTPLVYLTDTWRVTTREDIYSVYTQFKYAVTENQDVRARVRYEEDEGPESPYWRVQADYAIRF